MGAGDVIRPFRWDIAQRSQLGTLPDVELEEPYLAFEADLLRCAARVLAFGGDSDFVFIGRSPQPLFDLLSGLLIGTSWNDRLRLLNVSLSYTSSTDPSHRPAIYPYLEEVGLEPHALARRRRSVALVDVVASGWTLGVLVGLIKSFSESVGVEWRTVAQKIRIVGFTWRTKTSPNTRRWQQHAEWVDRLRVHEIKNVSVPWRLATYLASDAPKTNYSFTPESWTDEDAARPARHDEARHALALAVRLFDLGTDKDTRREFARAVGSEPAMAESWCRSLILELKR
jgi:hypothetical protein